MRATVFIVLLSMGAVIELLGATGASIERSDLIMLDKGNCESKCYLVKAAQLNGKFIPVVDLDEVVISAKRKINEN